MTTDARPDPDELVERIRQEARQAGRGRLRIYFGSAAGVGKTYAMLVAARARKAAGTDVVAGVIETHGRAETAAQLAGLELLPRRGIARADRPLLTEFDLDGALARKPALILVDELAHSNVAGSRHPKRWQDVDELLASGIDVWTTLNVQHLETLNDIVGGITGIRVHETLPDTFFDAADEVVLVDTPADELLGRLKAGKVYGEAQAERAAANFFRKGNLMALRELALRRTADRVEDDVQTYRADRSITPVWKTESAILCCIGPGRSAEHVVRSAALLAQQLAVSWHAVYIETPRLQRLAGDARRRILLVVELAEQLGARTAVLPSSDVAAALIDYARDNNLSKVVMGHNRASFWRPAGTLAQQLGQRAADVDLIEIGAPPGTVATTAAARRADAKPVAANWKPTGYALGLVACGLLTALVVPLEGVLDQANIVMLYLLLVLGVAMRYGRGPAVLCAVVNVVAFDYFLVPPKLSFAVSDVQYVLTFGVMLAVGLIVGQLTAGLRFQARIAVHRERRSHALFEVARDLSAELVVEQVVETAAKAIAREFHAEVRMFVLAEDDRLALVGSTCAGLDAGTARWAFDHAEPAGLGTDTIPGSAWHYLPLKASMRTRGVLALQPESPRLFAVPEQRRQLQTFAALAAIALERVHYVDVAQKATVQIESERLRNSLLSALSHDLRTPLAGLSGLAESLQLTEPPLSGEQKDLCEKLDAAARRMTMQVSNLLDMARIESPEFRLASDWNSIEEIIGSAIRISEWALASRDVTTDVPRDLPLVKCDAVLIERVVVNLLENAAKYTPADACVRVAARVGATELSVSVADNGPGIPAGREKSIFTKFTRGVRESSTSGVGLGLAICKAIVEAHGGRIGAANHAGGGAVVTFSLPLPSEQPQDRPALDAIEEVE